ncbi:hypothetical protein A2U11_10145 [Fusobacterium necrophorum subsp. funduliforme]|uniref:hypothetical protein n=1 Tax=Fusobacterium necrophorum TaxID=859 RepID=UPI000786A175|nr:hypothetical protein [Fusobacterium necrophorum]KYM48127.1 hypothetical protein A2U04_05215 [Fusobacterium necrophorum subsp. funduliforme]KYM49774.1 hypothetical protein A2U11_10145 [Fusobacterium necrophorum subsp. funduliforme]
MEKQEIIVECLIEKIERLQLRLDSLEKVTEKLTEEKETIRENYYLLFEEREKLQKENKELQKKLEEKEEAGKVVGEIMGEIRKEEQRRGRPKKGE